MSILILEKEAVSRVALQQFLYKDGHKVVHSAKNDLEATKVIATRKSQIRFIIADYEILSAPGSQFLKKLSATSALDFCPVILTSSHLKKSALVEFKKLHPRIDFHLPKPFRASKLISAMQEGAVARFSLRDQLIVWTTDAEFKKFRTQHHDKKLIHVTSTSQMTSALSESKFRVGALLIDPNHYQNLMKESGSSKRDWLRSFKMTTFGALTRVVCLGDQPGIPRSLRKYSDLFSREALIEQIQIKISYGWFLKKIHEKCRASFQLKKYGQARSQVNKMLSIDPYNAEANAFLGRLYETQKLTSKATQAYKKANDLNPFLPEPYLGLMRTVKPCVWAEKAILYCPEHPDVLKAAASLWKISGEQDKANLLTKKIAELAR